MITSFITHEILWTMPPPTPGGLMPVEESLLLLVVG
jgi:hypothetical protein